MYSLIEVGKGPDAPFMVSEIQESPALAFKEYINEALKKSLLLYIKNIFIFHTINQNKINKKLKSGRLKKYNDLMAKNKT